LKIIDIHNQLSAKNYQAAVINYLSYSYVQHESSNFSKTLVRCAVRQLHQSLTARALSLVSVDNINKIFSDNGHITKVLEPQIDIWLDLCVLSGLENVCYPNCEVGWCRFDFIVCGDVTDKNGSLSLGLWPDSASEVDVQIPFMFNVCQCLLFPIPKGVFCETSFHRDICVDGYGFSFTLTPLEDSQVVEHLLEQIHCEDKAEQLNEYLDLQSNSENLVQKIRNFQYLYIKKYYFGSSIIIYDNNCSVYQKLTKSIDEVLLNFYNEDPLIVEENVKSDHLFSIVESFDELGSDIEFYFDVLHCLESLYILYGWIADPSEQICAIRFVDRFGGLEIDLLGEFVYFERADVVQYLSQQGRHYDAEHGFACAVKLFDGCRDIDALSKRIEVVTISGKRFLTTLPVHKLSGQKGLEEAMRIIPSAAISPDICEKLYKRLFLTQMNLTEKTEESFNEKHSTLGNFDSPRLSVIIPLFGSVRFELTQIPTIAALRQSDWELIFAVDDSTILNDVQANVCRLAKCYGLTAKVIAPNHNLGFAGINNFAVERCSAKMLLFLNSDCFITNLDSILSALDRLDGDSEMGAIGFRLLYADNTIQHDGMSVEKWQNQREFFINAHPRQGLPHKLISQDVLSDVGCLLTGACLLMPRSIFDSVGGFDRGFLMGDFEDSDLCLKILESGKKLGIVRAEGIFHLERQSIKQVNGLIQHRMTLTNSNSYSNKWRAVLEEGLLAPLTVV